MRKMKRYRAVVLFLALLFCFGAPARAQASGAAGEPEAGSADAPAARNTSEQAAGDAVPNYRNYIQSAAFSAAAEDAGEIAGPAGEAAGGAQAEITALYGREVLAWSNRQGSVVYRFSVAQDGLYRFCLDYATLEAGGADVRLGLRLDGAYPFSQARELVFRRLWQDDGLVRTDGAGNEFAPRQSEKQALLTGCARDETGREAEPYLFALSAGEHTLELAAADQPVAVAALRFEKPPGTPSYADYIRSHGEHYTGEPLTVQGESADTKSAKHIIPRSDKSDPATQSRGGERNNAFSSRINYIGGTNWQSVGDTVTWRLEVPASGLYRLDWRVRQKDVANGVSFRRLEIDGVLPFAEAAALSCPYNTAWQYLTPSAADGEPYLFYLEAGTREISLTVTLGALSGIYGRLEDAAEQLGRVYRQIVMITGEAVDPGRSYELFRQIPQFNERLEEMLTGLRDISADLEALQGRRGGSGVSTVNEMCLILEKMLDNPYTAHRYKSSYYTRYAAVSSYLVDLRKQPLDLDYFVLSAPGAADGGGRSAGFFQRLAFSLSRFIASFTVDYNTVSGGGGEGPTLDIWINWGRDQSQILGDLIRSNFTPQHGINVNLKVTNATLIQGVLSGNGPDLSLHLPRSYPVNYAMRGVLLDLSDFPDFGGVMERFAPGAGLPYEYGGGAYALPDTQVFNLLFVRTDVMAELGLDIPKTWDEFLETAAFIQQNNLQVGVPASQVTAMSQVNAGLGSLTLFPTLLMQMGGSVYDEAHTRTALDTPEAVQAFSYLTSLYTEYKLPLSYDFYSRFRMGTMPLAIAPYTQYITLSSAAPEIGGRWTAAPLPGFADENGTINNVQAGAGTGCSILRRSGNPGAAWEFLKWWTSADTQTAYSTSLESVLGVAGRNPSANMEAVSRLSWSGGILGILETQWKTVRELPELPGGYYVPRSIDMAFWNTVNRSEKPSDMLLEWSRTANAEIERKRKQYGAK